MCRICTSWVAAFEASGSFRSVCVQAVPGQLEVDVSYGSKGSLSSLRAGRSGAVLPRGRSRFR